MYEFTAEQIETVILAPRADGTVIACELDVAPRIARHGLEIGGVSVNESHIPVEVVALQPRDKVFGDARTVLSQVADEAGPVHAGAAASAVVLVDHGILGEVVPVPRVRRGGEPEFGRIPRDRRCPAQECQPTPIDQSMYGIVGRRFTDPGVGGRGQDRHVLRRGAGSRALPDGPVVGGQALRGRHRGQLKPRHNIAYVIEVVKVDEPELLLLVPYHPRARRMVRVVRIGTGCVKRGHHEIVGSPGNIDVLRIGSGNRIGHGNADAGSRIVVGVVEVVLAVRIDAMVVPHHTGKPDGIPATGRPTRILPCRVFPILGLPQDLRCKYHIERQITVQIRQIDHLEIVIEKSVRSAARREVKDEPRHHDDSPSTDKLPENPDSHANPPVSYRIRMFNSNGAFLNFVGRRAPSTVHHTAQTTESMVRRNPHLLCTQHNQRGGRRNQQQN